MKSLLVATLLSLTSAAAVKRWCPPVIPSCTARYYVTAGQTCQGVADAAGIQLDKFYDLNPSINDVCTNMLAWCEYCVAGDTGNTGGCPQTAPGCTLSEVVQSGDICWDLLNQPAPGDWALFAEFRALNPTINEGCTNLMVGCQYCLPDTPADDCEAAGGTWSNPVYSGQSCWDLIGGYGDWDRLEQFYTLNPTVWRGCANLQIGEKYCIPSA